MPREFRKVNRDNKFYPNLELLIATFTDTLSGTAPVRIYEDGYMFFEMNWAVFAYYISAGDQFLDQDNNVVQEGIPPVNADIRIGGPQRTDFLNRQFGFYNATNRHPWLILIGNIFALPHFNDADWLEKGNYPSNAAVTVLPQPKDPINFVRSFVFLHAANSPNFDQTFPTYEFDDLQRNMHFYTIVEATTFSSSSAQGRFQDVMASATFFRQFYRMNPWRDEATPKPQYTDPNNGGAPIRL